MDNLMHDYQNPYFESEETQQVRVEELQRRLERERAKRNRRIKLFGLSALGVWVAAFLLLAIPNVARVAYFVAPGATEALARSLSGPVDVDRSAFGEVLYEEPELELPPRDPSLPEENRLIIEKIGVDTEIQDTEDWETALEKGVWVETELGRPEEHSRPTILAAHRFGYLRWTREYRRANSFFNLPKIENGDIVKVVWNQRLYEYEIFEGYTSDKIENYDADLIFYTCEVLNSSKRVMRGARLLSVSGG